MVKLGPSGGPRKIFLMGHCKEKKMRGTISRHKISKKNGHPHPPGSSPVEAPLNLDELKLRLVSILTGRWRGGGGEELREVSGCEVVVLTIGEEVRSTGQAVPCLGTNVLVGKKQNYSSSVL